MKKEYLLLPDDLELFHDIEDDSLRFLRIGETILVEHPDTPTMHKYLWIDYKEDHEDVVDAMQKDDAGFLKKNKKGVFVWGESQHFMVGGEGSRERHETQRMFDAWHKKRFRD